jgi:hypothetical protein
VVEEQQLRRRHSDGRSRKFVLCVADTDVERSTNKSDEMVLGDFSWLSFYFLLLIRSWFYGWLLRMPIEV